MARRMNRHIGRKMRYPYEGEPPERQVAFVFDTNKCLGCQTCTVACKTAWTSGKGQESTFFNSVETKPYGGYPQGWDVRLEEVLGPARWRGGELKSRTIFETHGDKDPPTGIRPSAADYAHPNLGEDVPAGGAGPAWMFHLARICNHCDHPGCLAACPRKAIYKRKEDGVVLVDQARCRGYQECVRSCPYMRTFFNSVGRVSEKCVACFPRLERGEVPLCVRSCIGRIRLSGTLTPDSAEPRADNPLDYLVRIKKIALPLYPQFGTGPNVYYIPPLNVPDVYAGQLFGPGVEKAKTLYRAAADDPILMGALLLFGASDHPIVRFLVQGGEAIVVGSDAEGKTVAEVPFTEGGLVRPHHDEARGAYRHNS